MGGWIDGGRKRGRDEGEERKNREMAGQRMGVV